MGGRKSYLGILVWDAEPVTKKTYYSLMGLGHLPDEDKDADGYMVADKGNRHVSWLPKDLFEECFVKICCSQIKGKMISKLTTATKTAEVLHDK